MYLYSFIRKNILYKIHEKPQAIFFIRKSQKKKIMKKVGQIFSHLNKQTVHNIMQKKSSTRQVFYSILPCILE